MWEGENIMIYRFNTYKALAISEIGGKAKSLIEMTKAGLNVPEGFVLSVHFFKPWIKEIKASTAWEDLLKVTSKIRCDELKNIAIGLKFTKEQKAELDNALKNMKQHSLFAVRSSSPEEDLEGTSFAGMYETMLGITENKIEAAIAKAFSSMLDFRVMEYKNQNNIDLKNTSIAVIVQSQIASDVSGIGFSLNPGNNCYDEAVINASFGLGETIVSGIVTPDTYIVEKVKNEIIDKKINEKIQGLWLDKNGGTVERYNEKPTVQALTDEQIIEVAEMIKKCEEYYDLPIDTEWAYEGDKLYLLQARPITSYLPLFPEMVTNPGEEKYIYIDVMGLTQGFTDSLSVLGMDIWTKMLDIAKGEILQIGIDGGIIAINGRQYAHISNLAKGFSIKTINKMFETYDAPTRSILESIDLKGEYLPAKKTEKMKKIKGGAIKMLLRIGPSSIKSILLNHRRIRDEYVTLSKEARENVRVKLSEDTPFNKSIDDALEDFGRLVSSAGILFAGMNSMRKMKKLFKGEDIEDLVLALGMDLDGNPTSAMGHYMYKLACYDDIKSTKSGKEFERKIRNREYSRDFLKDYDGFMKEYGCRGFKEIDIAAPRAYEQPEMFFKQLININTSSNQLLNVKERRKKAYKLLLEKAKEGGFEKKFVKLATTYQETFGYREDPKYIYVACVDRLRAIALKLGDRFVEEGRLESREQIFDLNSIQIARAQSDTSFNLMKAREKNLVPYKRVAHVKEWPNVIDSRGKIFRPIRESADGDIVGDPIAPGIVRGRAKVLYSPYEKKLEPGEILVTKATEPAWTPIFVNAAGVVLEVGGPLQHGAIIAREYGIPCVSGVYDAQNIIKDGDLLEVDGSNGIVKIIK